MRKIQSQIESNIKIVDKRFDKVYKDLDVEKLQKQIDKKMSKEEVYIRLTTLDTRVNKIEGTMKADT